MDPENVYAQQIMLRSRLLDNADSIAGASSRDLAAHLLLYLHDTLQVGALAVEWLQRRFDADRVDGSFGDPSDDHWVCGQWESESVCRGTPSTKGATIDNSDPIIQRIWRLSSPFVLDSVATKVKINPILCSTLLATSTKSKMIMPLVGRNGRPFALINVDRTSPSVHVWNSRQINDLRAVLTNVVAPILDAANLLAKDDEAGAVPYFPGEEDLTAAELRVARLAARGLSYKEIARLLDRSVHTIDHQLRSIRQKIGAGTHAKLVECLSSIHNTKLDKC